MIKIVDINTVEIEGKLIGRHAEIIISNNGESYRWRQGGLPLIGDLQTILEANEAKLFTAAQAKGEAVDLYNVTPKRVVKALALVILDEINILRTQAGLTPRQASQIDDAILAKLQNL